MCLSNQLLHCHLHNKNPNIKKFYHVVSKFSFEHAFFSIFPSLSFHYHFLDSYLFLFRHLGFPQTHLPKLHHSYIFQLYSHLSHSHLQKILPFVVFTRLRPKIMQKTIILHLHYANIIIKFLIKKIKKESKKKNIYKEMGLKV